MNYFYSMLNNVKYYYNSMNPATLSGAIDVIVVEQPDGSYLSTPFHVRFGKWSVFNIDDKYVDIQVNNQLIDSVKMKLGDNGVAFFVEEVKDDEDWPEYLLTSPVPGTSAGESDEEKVAERKEKLTKTRKKNQLQPSRHRKKASETFIVLPPTLLTEKQGLPFSSSIFSLRKYRSLPDLRLIAAQYERSDDNVKFDEKLNHLDLNIQPSDKPITHSKSSILSKEYNDILKQSEQPKMKRKLNHSESDSDEEANHKSEKPGPSRSTPLDVADGALSDSEVDRHQRYGNHNENAEWKWGEYPKFKNKKKEKHSDDKKKDRSSEAGSSWNWFSWRSSQAPQEEGVYLGDLMNKDPEQLEKYFGTSCASHVSNVDSGNGCSVQPSPSSPSAMSMESLVDENVANQVSSPNASDTVKREAPSPQEVDVALEKADIVEKQILAGTEKDGEVAASTFNDEVRENFERQGELPPKTRSMSGTSVLSDISSVEDGEIGVYTSSSDGRRIRYKRTLRLKSDQLKDLQLQYGSNNARFSISTKIQGTAWCACHIYLLRWCERIVISDIDGTITKSDVLGHIIPAIGGTWAHMNIVDLYSRIQNNGYRIIYLSSRAIGQSYQTKRYLSNVIQDSKTLPDGPVLLSPTSVLMAFRKEVIERKPEEFKIACLTDLMSLFPVKKPFYAGFGNRETDIKSYVAANISPEKIFIIDPAGNVKNASSLGFQTNYDSMLKDNVVDYVFPPLDGSRAIESHDKAHIASFNYWLHHPNNVEDMELEKYESERTQK